MQWLLRAEKGDFEEKVMTAAAVKPKGGEMFLYHCTTLDHNTDFLCDEYTGFFMGGSNITTGNAVYKRFYYLKDEDGKTRLPFERHCYEIKIKREEPDKYMIVHYWGNETW